MVGKKGKGRYDDVDWVVYRLMQIGGLSVADIAVACERHRTSVQRAMTRLKSYPAETVMALRREALRRRLLEAEFEILRGDPVKGKRLLDACRALQRQYDEPAPGAAVSAGGGPADTAAEEAPDDDAIRQLRNRMLRVAIERDRRAGLARLGPDGEQCGNRGQPP